MGTFLGMLQTVSLFQLVQLEYNMYLILILGAEQNCSRKHSSWFIIIIIVIIIIIIIIIISPAYGGI